jgi:hypothetical protein
MRNRHSERRGLEHESPIIDRLVRSLIAEQGMTVDADGRVLLLKVGAAGGSVTLVGRRGDGEQWQFALVVVDQTEALLGETGDGVVRAPPVEILEWVGSWAEALRLMDRYPWARLHPVAVHPEFVERVRVAVEERLAASPQDGSVERARKKWRQLLGRAETQGREGVV